MSSAMTLSFRPLVEPCLVSDPNLPGASPPERQVQLVSRMMGNYLLRFGEDSAVRLLFSGLSLYFIIYA